MRIQTRGGRKDVCASKRFQTRPRTSVRRMLEVKNQGCVSNKLQDDVTIVYSGRHIPAISADVWIPPSVTAQKELRRGCIEVAFGRQMSSFACSRCLEVKQSIQSVRQTVVQPGNGYGLHSHSRHARRCIYSYGTPNPQHGQRTDLPGASHYTW